MFSSFKILFAKKIDYKSINLPVRGDSWETILSFAKRINGYKLKGSFNKTADIGNRKDINDLNISDLHVALFFEYRRYNHFASTPEPDAMEHIYKILDRMNELNNA